MFPYSENITIKDNLTVPYQRVLKEIGPLLTPERRARIDEVVRGRNFSTSIVLENIYDRGNSSAVMRTGEALGFQLFDVIELSEKFKVANRVASGADKWVHVRKWKSTLDCVKQLKADGFQICVTALSPISKPISEIDFTKPTAFVLGNEKDGASKEIIEHADHQIIIPMAGFVQSFNISVAGALGMYHIFHERERQLGKNADVTPEQQEILKAHYYMKTLDTAEDILSRPQN